MRSDGFDEEGHRADWRTKNPQFLDLVEDDLLRARSWNKKLYECEAKMPDRSVGELLFCDYNCNENTVLESWTEKLVFLFSVCFSRTLDLISRMNK